ncbi:transcription initiation factor TFIID subunit 12 [Aspergillus niger]|nr:transcription initiation factor TFIID subunit 12 [Aspergillus niger]
MSEQQKQLHKRIMLYLWRILTESDRQSDDYQTAHAKMTQILSEGLPMFQRYQPALQKHEPTRGLKVGRSAKVWYKVQQFSQLLPQIRNKVEGITLYLPPNIPTDQIQTWIAEAGFRYGMALQRQELGQVGLLFIFQQSAEPAARGFLTLAERREYYYDRLEAHIKLYREGQGFMNTFKEQQERFKAYWRKKGESGEVAFTRSA